MFMNYFASRDNQKGYDYFLNYLKIRTSFEPPIKLKLAEYYFKNKEYKKTEELIDQIFQDIDILIADHKERGIKIKITNPDIDDLYFLKGLALQKQNKLEEALGGVLLIDEAYSLGDGGDKDSFSKEAVDLITSYLSEHGHEFICIIAGYKEALEKRFFSINEGLARRFTIHYEIKPYKGKDLRQIFFKVINDNGWKCLEEEITDEETNNTQNKQ